MSNENDQTKLRTVSRMIATSALKSLSQAAHLLAPHGIDVEVLAKAIGGNAAESLRGILGVDD